MLERAKGDTEDRAITYMKADMEDFDLPAELIRPCAIVLGPSL
jgi:hypothetical protein